MIGTIVSRPLLARLREAQKREHRKSSSEFYSLLLEYAVSQMENTRRSIGDLIDDAKREAIGRQAEMEATVVSESETIEKRRA